MIPLSARAATKSAFRALRSRSKVSSNIPEIRSCSSAGMEILLALIQPLSPDKAFAWQTDRIQPRSSPATSCQVQRSRCVLTIRPSLNAFSNALRDGLLVRIATAQRTIRYSCPCIAPNHDTTSSGLVN